MALPVGPGRPYLIAMSPLARNSCPAEPPPVKEQRLKGNQGWGYTRRPGVGVYRG
jgi:hypothetical protein